LYLVVPVSAATQVSALVCGSDSHASLVLSQPKSDSVVADAHLTLNGTTLQASQVSTTLDGAYDQTVAVATGQSSFSLTMTLDPGTHTIAVTALDMCAQHNATSQLVITYQPAAPNMSATSQPASTVAAGGVTIEPQGTSSQVLAQSPPPSGVVQVFTAIGASLDIGHTTTGTPLQQAGRIVLVSAGLVLTVFGATMPFFGQIQLLVGGKQLAIAGPVPRIVGVIFIIVGLLV
jgi:hypothetical protein